MGWRFRKIFRQGPFQSTISKQGVGWSVGVSGFRYGVSANGHRHVSAGIPGTGLYWYKDLDSKVQKSRTSSQEIELSGTSATPSQTSSVPNPVEPWWKQKGIKD
jgi:hypothetical protein